MSLWSTLVTIERKGFMAAVINVELHTDPEVQPVLSYAAVESARLIRESRDALITSAGCVTIELLAEGRAASLNATRQWIHRYRKNGRLVTVDHNGNTLIPLFQLTDAFDLETEAGRVSQRLVDGGMSPWAIWRWFTSHNGWIDQTPLAALRSGDTATVNRAVAGILDDSLQPG